MENNNLSYTAKEQDWRSGWPAFFEGMGRVYGQMEAQLKQEFGLTLPDYNILLALWEAPEHRLRMGEIADRVICSPSRVTYLITKLCRDDLIVRTMSKSDRRGLEAHLTHRGLQTVIEATRVSQGIIQNLLLDDMSEEDLNQVADLFRKINTNLSGQEK